MPGGFKEVGTFPNRIGQYTEGMSGTMLSRLIFGRVSRQMYRLKQGRSSPYIDTMIRLEALTGVPIQELYREYWDTELEKWKKIYEGVR